MSIENSNKHASTELLIFTSGTFFMTYLAAVTLGVVSPTISHELVLSHSQSLWIINSYLLTLAMFTAPGGQLGDLLGHRQVLLGGLALIAVGSGIAALSPNLVLLLVGLGVSGIGGAALMPATVAMVSNAVAAHFVGTALGRTVAFGLTSFMLGPLIAGILTSFVSWRAALGFSALISAVFLLIGWRAIAPSPPRAGRFDLPGAVMIVGGVGLLMVAILQLTSWSFASPQILGLLAGTGFLFAAYARHSTRRDHPLLDLTLLANPAFRGGTLALVAGQFALNGYVVYIATYLQHIVGFTPMVTGVGMLVAYSIPPLLSPMTGRLTDRLGPRPVATAGASCLFVSALLAMIFAERESYLLMLPSLLAMGLASTTTITSLVSASSRALAPERRGEGQGLQVTLRWIAAALATSSVGVVIDTVGAADSAPVEVVAEGYTAGFALIAAVAAACLLSVRLAVPK